MRSFESFHLDQGVKSYEGFLVYDQLWISYSKINFEVLCLLNF